MRFASARPLVLRMALLALLAALLELLVAAGPARAGAIRGSDVSPDVRV